MKKKTLAAASLLLALLMPLGATPLAVYAEGEGEGTTQSETSTVSEDPTGTGETEQLGDGLIRIHASYGARTYTADKFREALQEAPNGSTIELGAGTYSLYKSSDDMSQTEQDAWKALMKDKTFTFVGQSPEKTFWRIGAEKYPGKDGEYNSDYSFEGSKSITFKNMKLFVPYEKDYLGFSHTNDTLVEDCVIEGRTQYWGYNSATFRRTKFVCAKGDYAYALWTYSSATETFDHCTFDASANPDSGKIIYVHNDGADKTFTINFNDCTVISSGAVKQVLYIKDVTDYTNQPENFIINISGNNIISGDVPVDSITCSRLFGFGGKEGNNKGNTTVKINDTTVWENGQRPENISHNGNTFEGTYDNGTDSGSANQYTEGYKDNKFEIINTTPWAPKADTTSTYVRTITKQCQYCLEKIDEQEEKTGYRLSYDLNGGTGAEGTYNDTYYSPQGSDTATVAAAPSRAGYVFAGWQDAEGKLYAAGETLTVAHDITLTAQWNKLVTVSFDLCGHGGANISSQTFVSGNKASEPTAPKEDGWVFGGWYTEKGCKYRFSFDSAVTSDITLYAKWDRVTTVVSAPVATPTPSPAPAAAPAAAATKTATVKNAAIPQTSDAFPMEGLLALLAVGAVGFGAAGWLRKKHH
ncbi:InlB B-repeat-containing protein [uncultured Gemmiger sp.]|uniref:InlB B-repeat-containing protein n=1 Tax=uncultured Gemmiger sp. TaxID=1623490 RepID=UPI0025F1EFF4|nr:InlB B-repeat-containing protein [uncultured Gemmiger sp.]